MRDQEPDSKALRAAFTARSTSADSHAATLAIFLPVAGFSVSKVLPESDGTNLPPMKALVSKLSLPAMAL